MPPTTAPPSPEVLAELLALHSHRFPAKATTSVIGDGGVPLVLPILIGNPTGASPARPGVPVFPAWKNLAANTMGAVKLPSVGADLVRDCLIYPTRGVLAGWEDRWPALVDNLEALVLGKIGARAAFVALQVPGEDPPESIRAHLDANTAACWRWLAVGGKRRPAVIVPPSYPQWQALTAAVTRDGADHVALLHDLVAACVKGDGLGELFAEYPGLALPLWGAVVKLAGAGAESRLGEW